MMRRLHAPSDVIEGHMLLQAFNFQSPSGLWLQGCNGEPWFTARNGREDCVDWFTAPNGSEDCVDGAGAVKPVTKP